MGNDTGVRPGVLADAREESGRVGVFGTDDALLEQPESFDGDVVLRVASAVERGPNLGSRRAVDVEPAVTAGPLVEPILFGVGRAGRDVGVIVAIRIAAVHELQRQMLNEPVPIADLRRRPRTEPEFVGRDSDAVALSRVGDESVVVQDSSVPTYVSPASRSGTISPNASRRTFLATVASSPSIVTDGKSS